MKKKVLAVVLVLVVAVVGFLYFPRGSALDALNSAVLGVLNSGVDASRSGRDFEPAFDGDIFATGDVVRADEKGRAVLTFFDGSTLSVEPASRVRVLSLAKTSSGGIQLELEQTAGRTWASVAKLTSPDSKFIIKTPSMTAVVRGTAFETIVTKIQVPDPADPTKKIEKVVTTIKTSEGEVVAQAIAGGEVKVPANTQADVVQDQPAPAAAQQQPPTPKLRFSGPAGVGFVVIDPRGLQCGLVAANAQKQIPRCEVLGGAGQSVVIGDVVAGTFTVVATAAQPVPDAAIVAEGLGIQATDFTQKITRSFALGDLVRTTLAVTVGGDGKLGSGGFTPAELVSSVCGAEATGRIFSSGELTERADLLVKFANEQKGAPAAVVYTQAELTKAAVDSLRQTSLPVDVSNVAVTIDNAGVHLTASVSAGFISFPARGDIIAGSAAGKLTLKLRNFDAGPVPSAAKEQISAAVDNGLSTFAQTLPLVVQRVAFRTGCFALIGKTPG